MENIFARVIEVGKTNKYNLPFRSFTDKQGKETLYRFYYPKNDKILCNVIEVVERSYKEELSTRDMAFLVSCLWVVEHKSTPKHHSKLDGLKSISTSALDNRFCIARMQDTTSICHNCYAAEQQEYNHGLQEHNLINGIILRNVELSIEVLKGLPFFFDTHARIESFGDVENSTQVRNYIRIKHAFPQTTFAVWTKNIALWCNTFDEMGKPENCTFTVSSCHKNVMINNIPAKWEKYIDHYFTVYTEDYIKAHGIIINCGGRDCKECIKKGEKCYFRGTEKDIKEKIK